MSIINDISDALQRGKKKEVTKLVQQAIDEGIDATTILKDGLLSGMNIIGEKFKNDEVFVPEVLVAARAMNAGTALLKPLLSGCLLYTSVYRSHPDRHVPRTPIQSSDSHIMYDNRWLLLRKHVPHKCAMSYDIRQKI